MFVEVVGSRSAIAHQEGAFKLWLRGDVDAEEVRVLLGRLVTDGVVDPNFTSVNQFGPRLVMLDADLKGDPEQASVLLDALVGVLEVLRSNGAVEVSAEGPTVDLFDQSSSPLFGTPVLSLLAVRPATDGGSGRGLVGSVARYATGSAVWCALGAASEYVEVDPAIAEQRFLETWESGGFASVTRAVATGGGETRSAMADDLTKVGIATTFLVDPAESLDGLVEWIKSHDDEIVTAFVLPRENHYLAFFPRATPARKHGSSATLWVHQDSDGMADIGLVTLVPRSLRTNRLFLRDITKLGAAVDFDGQILRVGELDDWLHHPPEADCELAMPQWVPEVAVRPREVLAKYLVDS